MRISKTWRLVGAIALAATGPLWAEEPRAAGSPGGTEAWYRLSARVRSLQADADLEAGGRLLMSSHPHAGGGRTLELIEIPEDPWKFYWVDPLGPTGKEVKLGAVVALPEGSWQALDRARRRIATFGQSVHADWSERTKTPHPLDGTFAFVVIGAANGRFRLQIDRDGSVSVVENLMTDRWLNGPFDQFVDTWGPVSDTEQGAPNGYWFWNDGETEPFEYEPHTYHAFTVALELLGLPVPETESESLPWPNATRRAVQVLETLAPKLETPSRWSNQTELLTVGVAVRELESGGRELSIRPENHLPGLEIERHVVQTAAGLRTSDRLTLRTKSSPQGRATLELEVGYRDIVVGDD